MKKAKPIAFVFFLQKLALQMAPKSPPIHITFSDTHIDVLTNSASNRNDYRVIYKYMGSPDVAATYHTA